MDYMDGGDIATVLKNPPPPMDSNTAVDYIRKLLLDISHPLQIVNDNLMLMHLDINPSNIMMHNNGKTDGSAKFDFYLIDLSRTSSIHRLMTKEPASKDFASKVPLWISPEIVNQWLNKEIVVGNNNCVDSYSLSVVAMHMYAAICSNSQMSLCGAAKSFQNAMEEFIYCMVCRRVRLLHVTNLRGKFCFCVS